MNRFKINHICEGNVITVDGHVKASPFFDGDGLKIWPPNNIYWCWRMKLCIGYYDGDGNYIGKKLDDPKREKYIIVMGEFRKQISEHEQQNPYKFHRKDDWTKTYCDKNRINVYADIFINGKKSQTVRSMSSWYYWRRGEGKELYDILEKIFKHVKTNSEASLMEKYQIDDRRIYYPMYIYLR